LNVYFDASALVKRYVEEPDARRKQRSASPPERMSSRKPPTASNAERRTAQ